MYARPRPWKRAPTDQDALVETKLFFNSPNFVVIVTGPRDWTDPKTVWRPLDLTLAHYGSLLVRNGKATRGVDSMVSDWTDARRGHGVTEDPHYADWDTHPRQAGFIRNGEMVKALPRADVVMAWGLPCKKNARWCPPGIHPTHGTADCVEQARAAGLRVVFSRHGMSW